MFRTPSAMRCAVAALTAAQKTWALATSAVLTERNRQRHDVLGGDEYLVGYLTEEEAWERIMYPARTLQSSLASRKARTSARLPGGQRPALP